MGQLGSRLMGRLMGIAGLMLGYANRLAQDRGLTIAEAADMPVALVTSWPRLVMAWSVQCLNGLLLWQRCVSWSPTPSAELAVGMDALPGLGWPDPTH